VTGGYQMVVSAGAGNTGDGTTAAVARVLDRDGPVEVVEPSNDDELDRVLDATGDRVLVVAGGDGSLHKVVERLWHRRSGATVDQTIGLVPLGTGNDFARGTGVPLEPEEAATAIVKGSPHRYDLIVDDVGGVAVNAVHVGVGAEAAEVASGLKDLMGPVAYPIGAVVAGLTQRGWRIEIEVDGRPVETPGDRVIMVGLANGPSIGGGTGLCPPARPDDGVLDVVVVAGTGPLARAGFARELQKGTHLERDDVVHRRGQRVRIVSEPLRHNVDGDLTDEIGERAYELVPGGWVLLARPRGGG
jgi:diacylglycerol kinase family enzyme